MLMPTRMSSASVCLARAPVSQPAELTAWSLEFFPPARDRLPTTVIWLRNGSNGLRIGVISRVPSVVFGVQLSMTQPLGRYTPPKRRGGWAEDCASGVMAGAIDSRKGRATAAPIPRRNVRRGNDFLAMTILEVSSG